MSETLTTGLFIEGEDILLPYDLSFVYQQTIISPHLAFLYLWKRGDIYYSLSLIYMSDYCYWRCEPDSYRVGLTISNRLFLYGDGSMKLELEEELISGNRNLTLRLLRWMCKYINEENLPTIVSVDPKLKYYLPSFIKMVGLEAIQQPSKGLFPKFKVIEKSAMELLYEGLI